MFGPQIAATCSKSYLFFMDITISKTSNLASGLNVQSKSPEQLIRETVSQLDPKMSYRALLAIVNICNYIHLTTPIDNHDAKTKEIYCIFSDENEVEISCYKIGQGKTLTEAAQNTIANLRKQYLGIEMFPSQTLNLEFQQDSLFE